MEIARETIRLLLVDDNADYRAAVLHYLESLPRVDVVGLAADGHAAVAQAARLQPDVVLMDVAMPGLSGLEATRQIGDCAPGVRVILLLSVASDEYRAAARDCGASGSVAKERLDEELLPALGGATTGAARGCDAAAPGGAG